LDLLGPVLSKSHGPFAAVASLWETDSIPLLTDLYAYVLDQQRRGDAGIFAGHPSPSYADNGFYSAAVRDYRDFLVVMRHEQRLWDAYRAAPADPHDLGRRLDDQPLEHAALLAADLDPADRTGRDVLRTVKARVNQDFFRKMVLDNYGHRCCLTGIPIPQVLRASHIIPWSHDASNRLNPVNGHCLAATYDAAFDAHLISFDDDLRLIFKPESAGICGR
jgi:putative restriction endonuclease